MGGGPGPEDDFRDFLAQSKIILNAYNVSIDIVSNYNKPLHFLI